MAKKKNPAAVELGRKGGERTGVAKGLAGMTTEKAHAVRELALAARKRNSAKRKARKKA